MAQIAEELRIRGRREGLKLAWKGRLQSWVAKAFIYLVLIDISFIFLSPVIYMVSTSLKTVADVIDPTVYWVPTTFNLDNFKLSWQALKYFPSWQAITEAWTQGGLAALKDLIMTESAAARSTVIAVLAAIGQVISCSLVGYGFARCKFPGRELLFMLAMFTFLVPPQTIIIPLFIVYKQLGWIDTYLPFIVPSFLANGLRGAIFIFIFRQFFRGLPWELEDAARMDGAGWFTMFWRVMLPLAKPAIVVSFLFSLVWHWNDYFEPTIYLMNQEKFTLPLRLSIFWTGLEEVTGGQASRFYNEPLIMAASFLVIVPPLILYIFTQRLFVESVERTGLVE
ncbi:MAG: carbohydrate ABC transporter permease [Limnochordales bacterium]|nr:carbohydrate ABC transporter permease [Limnochordales bacterium]